ncbi:glycerophosphoryl diester phosphodiesterase [Geomicrobium halophilum]|uniref:Glycerophosphoryl diester phosphodiesterase n=1 Tax=Geomicrobium halophilum TaxID=549000 RepID=A0A841PRY2_9BACL|nr:glycerophosphoryl diester phosphodiesterase [Geomicrobium halophilum]
MNKLFKSAVALMSVALVSCVSVSNVGAATEKITPTSLHYPEGKIVNVAHRGASGHAPEHTLPAYVLGEKLNGDYIEIDLQMTSDGTLIAMHDESVDRTTDGTGLVENMTLEEIKQLDAGSWFNASNPEKSKDEYVGVEVPTLEEIFRAFGSDSNYYIETKSPELNPGMEEELLRLLDNYDLSNNTIIQSFSSDSLELIRSMDPSLPLVQLLGQPALGEETEAELEEIKQYATGVGPNFNNINEAYVQTVRSHNLHIHPYTVNSKGAMRTALEWGVTGLFTDYPDRFNDVLAEFQSASYIKSLVEQFDEQGAFENEESVHALTLHLTAISHLEDQEEDKVVNHMEGFKTLLNYQKNEGWITDAAYDSLMYQADLLTEK